MFRGRRASYQAASGEIAVRTCEVSVSHIFWLCKFKYLIFVETASPIYRWNSSGIIKVRYCIMQFIVLHYIFYCIIIIICIDQIRILTNPEAGSKILSRAKVKNKRNPDRESRIRSTNRRREEEKLTAETNTMATLDVISKQIQIMEDKLKSEFKMFKEAIVNQTKNDLAEFKGDLHQQLTKVAAELREQSEKIDATLTREFEGLTNKTRSGGWTWEYEITTRSKIKLKMKCIII